jgi:hypothetical protein
MNTWPSIWNFFTQFLLVVGLDYRRLDQLV